MPHKFGEKQFQKDHNMFEPLHAKRPRWPPLFMIERGTYTVSAGAPPWAVQKARLCWRTAADNWIDVVSGGVVIEIGGSQIKLPDETSIWDMLLLDQWGLTAEWIQGVNVKRSAMMLALKKNAEVTQSVIISGHAGVFFLAVCLHRSTRGIDEDRSRKKWCSRYLHKSCPWSLC